MKNAWYYIRFYWKVYISGFFNRSQLNGWYKQGYYLDFNDEFNLSIIDWRIWDWKPHYGSTHPDYPFNNFEQSQVTAKNGYALLTSDLSGDKNIIGGLFSYRYYNILYGYFEARMKLPTNGGLFWPAFWLSSKDIWPPEIDIFELMGEDSSYITFTLHWNNDKKNKAQLDTILEEVRQKYGYKSNSVDDCLLYLRTDPWEQAKTDFAARINELRVHEMKGRRLKFKGKDFLSKDYHTYAVSWEPNRVTWYIDNVAVYTLTKNSPSLTMYVLMNNYAARLLRQSEVPQNVAIDYIRIYKKNPL